MLCVGGDRCSDDYPLFVCEVVDRRRNSCSALIAKGNLFSRSQGLCTFWRGGHGVAAGDKGSPFREPIVVVI